MKSEDKKMVKRKDGTLVEMDPYFRIIPLVMNQRIDAHVYYSQEISLKPIDDYIRKKQAEGVKLAYMHVIYAAMVRTLKERPKLNQFIMGGRLYRRNNIEISMTVKKDMSIDGEESSIKLTFTGDETPEQIKNRLKELILAEKEGNSENNETDAFVKYFAKTPTWILKLVVNFLKSLDKVNLLPKSIIDLSPFHASACITNLGSIGLDAAFHHIYNFGTIGIFLSIGRKKKRLVLDKDQVKEEKTIELAFVSDERICDGYYYASAMKQFYRYLSKPESLDEII